MRCSPVANGFSLYRFRTSRRNIPALICMALAASPVYAQHGIDSADLNRQAAACTDFFDYANGAWRAQHPIPDYMDRWSKRWESGETNKSHVRDILTEVS